MATIPTGSQLVDDSSGEQLCVCGCWIKVSNRFGEFIVTVGMLAPTFLYSWTVLEAGGLGGRLRRVRIRVFAGVYGHNHIFHAGGLLLGGQQIV